jgi:hypothetical protein
MKLTTGNGVLRLRLEGWEKFLAVKRTIELPLSHVRSVSTSAPRSGFWDIRMPGSFLPGVIKAGTYYSKRGKEFWYATRKGGWLVIELKGESYRRIVLTTKENAKWMRKLKKKKR